MIWQPLKELDAGAMNAESAVGAVRYIQSNPLIIQIRYSILLKKEVFSMYYYSTVNDIVTTHSAILEQDGFDIVKIHFERPNNDGFDFLDMTLPGEIVYKSFGFSEDEILYLKRYAKNNSSLIWDFAQKGGGINA